MSSRAVHLAVVSVYLAFATAAGSFAFYDSRSAIWLGAVSLVILSGITPLIYTVNARIVPVFSRRIWQHPKFLLAAVGLAGASGWGVFVGSVFNIGWLTTLAHVLAVLGAICFVYAVMTLFRSAPLKGAVAPGSPDEKQGLVDKIALSFTKVSACYLLLGTAIGLLTRFWTPSSGRWSLMWVHMLVLGWFMLMVAGVCYHVMGRWSGARWRSVMPIRLHWWLVAFGLPLMFLALATNWIWLFAIAGPIQAIALALFLANIAPMVLKLPQVTRVGLLLAATFLLVGITIGALAAIDLWAVNNPVEYMRLTKTHGTLNVMGWAGLLICSVGYYLLPRFAGKPLVWRNIAQAQVVLHAAGILVLGFGWWWATTHGGWHFTIPLGAAMLAASFLMFGAVISRTMTRVVPAPKLPMQLTRQRPAQT